MLDVLEVLEFAEKAIRNNRSYVAGNSDTNVRANACHMLIVSESKAFIAYFMDRYIDADEIQALALEYLDTIKHAMGFLAMVAMTK